GGGGGGGEDGGRLDGTRVGDSGIDAVGAVYLGSEGLSEPRRRRRGVLRRPDGEKNSFNHRYNNNNNNYSYGGGYNNYYGGGGGGGGSTRYAPYRAFSGHSKQGSRHLYPDEFRHGSMPSRPNEKMLEDGSCRPSGSWRYGRYSREYRGSSVQKDWKVHSSEITSRPYGSGRLNNTSDKSSADVMPSHNSSTPYSDSIKSRDQSLSKYQHESNGIFGSFGSTGQKLERDNSLNPISWKPLKWARSGSLSVRNSGISHSSRYGMMSVRCGIDAKESFCLLEGLALQLLQLQDILGS
ncbi:hypothetical protein Leryth_006949, partial [Lithospermum erythrorhizon]